MSNDIYIYIYVYMSQALCKFSFFLKICLGFFIKHQSTKIRYFMKRLSFFCKRTYKRRFYKKRNIDKEKLQYFSYKPENKDASLLNPLLSV